MSEKKRKPGRPGRPRTVGERVPLGLRVSTELKTKLDGAAKASGRSQSQEAELRLEQSLKSEEALYKTLDLAYGHELTAIILAVARALHLTGTRAVFVGDMTKVDAKDWMLDPYAFDQAARAANVTLEAFRPRGKVEVPHEMAPHFNVPPDKLEVLGEEFAQSVLAAIRNFPKTNKPEEWARPIRERLAKSDVQIRIEKKRTTGGPEKER